MKIVLQNLTKKFPSRNRKSPGEVIAVNDFTFEIPDGKLIGLLGPSVKGYQVSFGRNYFPEKTYKGIVYDAGYYESLVVTLGKGEGDNWWCVLFPPLCLLEADESEEEVEYKFFFQELIDKYL